MAKKGEETRVNEQIRARTVRLISGSGDQLGILSLSEALETASSEGMDLVEVAPNSDPPVCRIMDFGKFKYQASKKEQEARKKGKSFQNKEIKFRPHTDEHDLDFKIKNLRKFLEKKSRVKITVMFRGRELSYKKDGLELLQRVAAEVDDLGSIDQPPREEGRNLSMVIVPR